MQYKTRLSSLLCHSDLNNPHVMPMEDNRNSKPKGVCEKIFRAITLRSAFPTNLRISHRPQVPRLAPNPSPPTPNPSVKTRDIEIKQVSPQHPKPAQGIKRLETSKNREADAVVPNKFDYSSMPTPPIEKAKSATVPHASIQKNGKETRVDPKMETISQLGPVKEDKTKPKAEMGEPAKTGVKQGHGHVTKTTSNIEQPSPHVPVVEKPKPLVEMAQPDKPVVSTSHRQAAKVASKVEPESHPVSAQEKPKPKAIVGQSLGQGAKATPKVESSDQVNKEEGKKSGADIEDKFTDYINTRKNKINEATPKVDGKKGSEAGNPKDRFSDYINHVKNKMRSNSGNIGGGRSNSFK